MEAAGEFEISVRGLSVSRPGLANLLIRGQVVNILGFAGNAVGTTQFSCCITNAVVDTQTNWFNKTTYEHCNMNFYIFSSVMKATLNFFKIIKKCKQALLA